MNIRKISLALFFILIAALSYFMLIPHPPEIASGFRFMDKIEHFSAFFILAVLLTLGTGRRRVVLLLAVLVVYGALIEFIQRYTGRSAELSDFIADVAGTVAGCIVSLFFL